MSYDLLISAIISGLLLGGFYAAVSSGLQIAFGLLDVPHVAHPTMLVLGGYMTFLLSNTGLDPLIAGLVMMPLFFVIGSLLYRFYHVTFERRGGHDKGLRGLAFFFGIVFIVEVLLILTFGVDQRLVEAPYIGTAVSLFGHRIPLRMLVAFAIAVLLTMALMLYLSRTFLGRAIRAVSQEEEGLALVGADPVKIKQHAFGIATATAALTGALLIIVTPIEPALGRVYLGKMFSIVVLAGLGSMPGTFLAAMILGVAESVVLSSFGSSWAPAVAFGILLAVLAVKPSGLLGRA